MEANGVFQVEMEMNGRYSFKSLLLDGEAMDDDVEMEGGTAQLVLAGDLDAVEETLYGENIGMGARESFKSLLLDGGTMEEDEVHFSSTDQNGDVENGNHVHMSELPAATVAPETVVLSRERAESFSKDTYQRPDSVDRLAVNCVEVGQAKESEILGRKRRRGDGGSPAIVGQSNASGLSAAPLTELVRNEEHVADVLPQPSQPPPQPSTTKQQQAVSTLLANKKKKQPAASGDVQKLLDSVIARQEMFFADLLESMERKEAIRERTREEKEEKWRADERAQLGVFNNAMLALTQELLGEAKTGAQLIDKSK